MAANDDDESTAVIVGVLAGIMLAVVAVVYGASAGKAVKPKAAPVVAQVAEEPEIAPVGEALALGSESVGLVQLAGTVASEPVQAPPGSDRGAGDDATQRTLLSRTGPVGPNVAWIHGDVAKRPPEDG